jgi:hypothetical protein
MGLRNEATEGETKKQDIHRGGTKFQTWKFGQNDSVKPGDEQRTRVLVRNQMPKWVPVSQDVVRHTGDEMDLDILHTIA